LAAGCEPLKSREQNIFCGGVCISSGYGSADAGTLIEGGGGG